MKTKQLLLYLGISLIICVGIVGAASISEVLGYILFGLFALGIFLLGLKGMYNVVHDGYHSNRVFKIRKGRHYCSRLIPRIYIKKSPCTFEQTFTFTESCLYEKRQHPWVNKLWGITFGLNPHKNSIRAGWKCMDGSFHLFSYIYVNGHRSIKYMGKAEVGEPIRIIIYIDAESSYIDMCGKLEVVHIDISQCFYENRPYFGGKPRSPQTMFIENKFVR